MAFELQTGESGLPIGANGEVLPEELSNAYFQNLDAALARAEKTQMDRTLGGLSDRGFLRSGDTFTQVAQDVLGPSQDRRNQVLLPEMQRAAGQGREERLGQVAYDRQTEMQKQAHLDRLDELQKQAEIKSMLLNLQSDLNDPGGFDWAAIGGQALGMAAGGIFGGVGAGVGNAIAKRYGGGSNKTTSPYETDWQGF